MLEMEVDEQCYKNFTQNLFLRGVSECGTFEYHERFPQTVPISTNMFKVQCSYFLITCIKL